MTHIRQQIRDRIIGGKYNSKEAIDNVKYEYEQTIENNFTQQLFHAGTIEINKKILTNGGRVLNATVLASSLQEARNKAHQMLDLLDWEDKYFRRDIAWRAIK